VIADALQLTGFGGTAWLVARLVDWFYRGNDPMSRHRPTGGRTGG
jgi:hypothetical protein